MNDIHDFDFEFTPTEWVAPQIDNTAELTLITAIKQVTKIAEGSKLCDEFFECASRPLAYVAERMNLTRNEALFLCFFAHKCDSGADLSYLSRFFDCDMLDMITYQQDIDSLAKKGFLKCIDSMEYTQYKILNDVLKAIATNTSYTPPRYDNLTIEELFARISKLLSSLEDYYTPRKEVWQEVLDLCQKNNHLEFVCALNALNLSYDDACLFLYSCDMLVSKDDTGITRRDLTNILDGKSGYVRILWSQLAAGKANFIKKKLWQPHYENGMASTSHYELTDYVRNEMLRGLGVERVYTKSRKLTSCETITPKELFYNPKEKSALDNLFNLLGQNNFKNVCSRLMEKGMRRGFTCIFYGGPGTGKTETVLQLARKTGRDIMQVDLASIRSKYVGESEQNIKGVFDSYRRELRRTKPTPILFFNEADAIISKRNRHVEDSVDKMENTIQNIILQEMEVFEGIMIATTNLTENMDSAFERRFLYKIEFQKPSNEAKSAIWRSMIPSLSEEEAMMLAIKYEFSGGQIENIARKNAVEEVLWGRTPTIDRIVEFCNEERLGDNHRPQRRIGFIQ